MHIFVACYNRTAMSSVSSDYESSYYTESEAESDYVTHEVSKKIRF